MYIRINRIKEPELVKIEVIDLEECCGSCVYNRESMRAQGKPSALGCCCVHHNKPDPRRFGIKID